MLQQEQILSLYKKISHEVREQIYSEHIYVTRDQPPSQDLQQSPQNHDLLSCY